jgi:hypothetical protein
VERREGMTERVEGLHRKKKWQRRVCKAPVLIRNRQP